MAAVALWVRTTLRRRWAATVVLAVLAGLSAGIVGASLQSARRADGAVQRHHERSRTYDYVMQACPPEAGVPESFEQVLRDCISPDVMTRFANEVLAPRDDVEQTTVLATYVGGVLDSTARNGWGRVGIMYVIVNDDPVGFVGRQVLVGCRFADPAAPDEVMVGEQAARVLRVHVGDVIQMASWSQDTIDSATSAGAPPNTTAFGSTVVGIVRYGRDVQSPQGGDLTEAAFPDALYAERGWVAAHGGNFATFGAAVGVRVRDGIDVTAFSTSVQEDSHGWFMAPPEIEGNVDLSALERSVSAERQATLIFALIGVLAGMTFIGLTLARQLRRELADAPVLSTLGFTRSYLLIGAVARSLVAGLAAGAVAGGVIVLTSPFGPVGVAGRLEYEHPIRFDVVVLLIVCVGAPLFFAGIAAATVVLVGTVRVHSVRRARASPPLGPVPRVAANFARGGSPRVAGLVGAVAIGATLAAGVLAASFDRVIDEPARYGAWWDVAVGQYSDPDEVDAALQQLSANSSVADVSGVLEEGTTAVLDGVGVPYVAIVTLLGDPPTLVSAGRAPVEVDEVALGAATARALHKGIGDTLTLTSTNNAYTSTVRVVGIAVLNNPINDMSNAGDGVMLTGQGVSEIVQGTITAQSLVVRLKPDVDRDAAIASIARDFGGSTRLAGPPTDLRNLQRLRFVPWMVAALIAVLALASLVHALVTLLQRHSGDLAVMAALGMTTRQRRRVGLGSGLVIVGLSSLVGVPAGLVLGRLVWRVVAHRVFIPSSPVMPWPPTVLAPLIAVAATVCVAAIAVRWVTRHTPAAQLRSE
ncbi:MAG: ABC transporter permease [Ilumatobacteraceae bacterium]